MVDREFYEAVKKGTTTVGLICSDGVVMGSDSRATMDTFIASSEAVKIHRINEVLGMTIAGGVGDAEYLVKLLKMQDETYTMEEGKPLNPTSATSLLSLILQENKGFPFLVQLLIGGLKKGNPEIFNIDPLGGYTKESKFTATGSGSLTALGYIEGIYDDGLTTQESLKHVAKALKIAMKRDSATGDSTRIVSITKKGYRELSRDEIDKLLK
ncbi:MAG: proteasome subunit beta [Candidatus Marsarchaeota archaeon]|nr:proteasome subunit beta [Candidatus Marsarchaeota archaeon]MCL5412880.1 proteasome subunit beta [Candidatus Marsarchaeota archaeon]